MGNIYATHHHIHALLDLLEQRDSVKTIREEQR